LRQASSSPARTRSRRMSRSNSEKTESSPAMARPVGVVRSRALLQTPASCESAAAESSDHAIMRRDAGIQTNAKHFLRFTLVAENPLRFRLCGCLFGGHCQRKVEMSYSPQSRNVRFCRWILRGGFSLGMMFWGSRAPWSRSEDRCDGAGSEAEGAKPPVKPGPMLPVLGVLVFS
jgi:hypothetical protein